jgi:thiol-disulfide isomerase/thioredoxin
MALSPHPETNPLSIYNLMKTRAFLTLTLATLTMALLPQSATAGEFPKGSPKFLTSYRKVLSEQKETGKPAILIFSATWCGPCQDMKKNVYPSPDVTPFHDKFIWAYLDADDSQNKKAKEKYAVQGIPLIEFLDTTGESMGQQIGSSSPRDFAKKLEAMLAKATPASPEKK